MVPLYSDTCVMISMGDRTRIYHIGEVRHIVSYCYFIITFCCLRLLYQ